MIKLDHVHDSYVIIVSLTACSPVLCILLSAAVTLFLVHSPHRHKPDQNRYSSSLRDLFQYRIIPIHPNHKNEVVYILPAHSDAQHQERLKAEVLRINGKVADVTIRSVMAVFRKGDGNAG